MIAPKIRAYLTALVPVLVADRATKALVLAHVPPGVPYDVVGHVARLTLVLNPYAAMNLTLGPWSRWGFAGIAVVGVIVMLHVLRLSAPTDRLRAAALGLICAGAIGNLIDRLRWDRGVIDFIDLGIGAWRFWTFNVADAGVTVGALLMVLVLSRERAQAPVSSGA